MISFGVYDFGGANKVPWQCGWRRSLRDGDRELWQDKIEQDKVKKVQSLNGTPAGAGKVSALFDPMLAKQRQARALRRLALSRESQKNKHGLDCGYGDVLHTELEEGICRRLQDFKAFCPEVLALTGCYRETLPQVITSLWSPPPGVMSFWSQPITGAALAEMLLDQRQDHRSRMERQADALVLCNNLHHIDDVPGYLLQGHLFLKEKGVVLGAVFGEETLQELEQSLLCVEDKMFQRVVPRCEPKLDIKTLGSLLQRAGFKNPVVDKETYTFVYKDLPTAVGDIRTLSLSPALYRRALPYVPQKFWRMVEEDLVYQSKLAFRGTPQGDVLEDNEFVLTFDILYFMGQKF